MGINLTTQLIGQIVDYCQPTFISYAKSYLKKIKDGFIADGRHVDSPSIPSYLLAQNLDPLIVKGFMLLALEEAQVTNYVVVTPILKAWFQLYRMPEIHINNMFA